MNRSKASNKQIAVFKQHKIYDIDCVTFIFRFCVKRQLTRRMNEMDSFFVAARFASFS